MTDDEILKAFEDAGGMDGEADWSLRFASLIEARTIERCAEVCEDESRKFLKDYPQVVVSESIAAAIRALKEGR